MGVSVIDDMLEVWFLFEQDINDKDINEIINKYIEIGCSTREDGQVDTCRYHPPDYKEPTKTISTKSAIEQITSSGEGGIELWYKNIRIDLEINLSDHIFPSTPHIAIKIWSAQFRPHQNSGDSDVTERVLQFVELVRLLAELSNPMYVFGSIDTYDDREGIFTEQILQERQIQHIFWINILSEPMIAQLGENRVMSAPAWKVEKLSTDSILLVVNDSPREYMDKAEEIEQHLNIE